MYRDAEPSHPQGRNFTPVPLGITAGALALVADFFALFLLSWGVAPTSIGCGAARSVTMVIAFAAITATIFAIFAGVGLGLMREARAPQLRRRRFVATAGAIYAVGVIPLFAFAALVGSCFDF
ncbi:MAG: hypothetical protein ACRDKI_10415 [Solirubrobacterales bacterium]